MNTKAIYPILFFLTAWECPYISERPSKPLGKKYRAPHYGSLSESEDVKQSDVSVAWNEEGLYFQFQVHLENSFLQKPFYCEDPPHSIELFLDTRHLKNARMVHKFCHHFLYEFNEESITLAEEATRFRGEDHHPLCDATLLHGAFHRKSFGYHTDLFLPTSVLFGFDPLQFRQIGFNYRIKRYGAIVQCYILHSVEENLELHPHLWSTLQLVE